MRREKQRNSATAQNRRVAGFFLTIVVLLGAGALWLMFVEPQPPMVQVEKELTHDTAITR